jgi:hypothetical protein
MNRKARPGPPAFVPLRRLTWATGDGAEAIKALLRRVKSPRDTLAENLATMRAAAERALALPDAYDTHAPARVTLEKLIELDAALEGPAGTVSLLNAMAIAAATCVRLQVNATLSGPLNQVRARNKVLDKNRHKAKPKHDADRIRKVLARGLTVKEEMTILHASRSAINTYRRKYAQRKNTIKLG